MASETAEQVDLVEAETVKQLSGAVLLAALTGVLAQFSVPLPGGIPFSLQPFGVFFAAILLGPLWGGFSLALYFVVGVAGAPVFSNAGAGLGYVLNPTGGFLLGFVVAAVVIGAVTHRSLTPRSVEELPLTWVTAGLLAGLVPIYLIGIAWIPLVADLTLVEAAVSMAPFLVGDLLKVALTVGIVHSSAELLGSRL